MSGRFLAVVVAAAVLVAASSLVVGRDKGEKYGERSGRAAARGAGGGAVAIEARTVWREARERFARERLRRHAHEDGVVPVGVVGQEDAIRRQAEPIARRFLAAFARYELGAGQRVQDELRATATRKLASDLLAAPPRSTAAGRPDARAQITGGFDLVLLGGRRSQVGRIELVGERRRGAGRFPVSVEMRRVGGTWRVSRLGR